MMNQTTRVLLGLLLTGTVASGPALAHGPSGSYEGHRTHRTKANDVRCRGGTRIPAVSTVAYAGNNGAEVCSDRGPVPVQGRVIATTQQNGYVAIDGDRNNHERLRGYARADRTGVHCSHRKDQDSTHSRTHSYPRTCDGE